MTLQPRVVTITPGWQTCLWYILLGGLVLGGILALPVCLVLYVIGRLAALLVGGPS